MIEIFIFSLMGALKGLRDTEMKFKSTWKNKYHPDMLLVNYWIAKGWKEKLYKEYHKAFNLKYKEDFPLSATFLVFLTDKWHLYDFSIFVLVIGVVLLNLKVTFLSLVFAVFCYWVTFHIFYTLYNKPK